MTLIPKDPKRWLSTKEDEEDANIPPYPHNLVSKYYRLISIERVTTISRYFYVIRGVF